MINGWNEMTVEQFQNLPEIEGELNIENIVNIIAVLSNQTINEVESEMSLDELNIAIESMIWLLNPPPGNILNKLKLKGVTYKMSDDYNRDLCYGEWMDLESFISGGFKENLHNIMAVLYRPKKSFFDRFKKKEDYTIEFFKRAELFKELTMDKVYPTLVFFWIIVKQYLQNTLDYSVKQIMEEKNQLIQDNQELKG
jgi:hypothetical protein